MAPHRLSSFFLALSTLPSVLAAQVPPGSGVYATGNVPAINSSGADLWVFQQYSGTGWTPCSATRPAPITNLPAELSIPSTSPTLGGGNCVLVRDSDGSVVAGTILNAPASASIYHLTLNGTRVTTFNRHILGGGIVRGAIDQMAWLNDDEIVFCYTNVSRANWPSRGVGRLKLSSGAFSLIPVSFPSSLGRLNALALDRARQTIYLGFVGTGNSLQLYSVAIGGGTARLVTTSPIGPYQLDVDHTGKVYIATFGGGLDVYDPATKTMAKVSYVPHANAMTIDRVSGDLQFIQSAPRLFPSWMFRLSMLGARGTVGVPGVQYNDAVGGIAIRSCMIPMGTPASPARYQWQVAPNPGGAPLIGNLGFSVTVTTTTSPTVAGLLVAPGMLRAPIPIGAANLWLALPVAQMSMAITGQTLSAALPLPRSAALCGLNCYAQAYSADAANVLTSSRPLWVTLQ